ncbi:MAG: hypothetical protein ACFFD4_12370 [Candidatus Odinarchaeota archaeon]
MIKTFPGFMATSTRSTKRHGIVVSKRQAAGYISGRLSSFSASR